MDLTRSLFQSPASATATATAGDNSVLYHPYHDDRLWPSTTTNHFLSLLFFQESNSVSTSDLIDPEQLKHVQSLKRTFETCLASIVRERDRQHGHQLVILCPVQQSLMGTNALLKLEWEWGGMDEEFIMSHIVRIPDRDHPVTKSLSVTTLNGRTLIVTDTTVTTAKGFKLLKQARLVSEQIFYDDEGRGWLIQFIDRPLVGIPQNNDQILLGHPTTSTATTLIPEDKGNDITYRNESNTDRLTGSSGLFSPPLRAETHSPIAATTTSRRNRYRLGQYSIYNATDPYSYVHRRSKGRPFLTLHIVLQRFPGVSQKLEKLIMDFNDAMMAKNNLDDIRTAVDRLLANSVELMNKLDSKILMRLLDEYKVTVDVLDQLLENHIMNSTYDIVFFKITLQFKQQDWDLSEAIRDLRNLDLVQIGLSDTPQHYQCLVSALNEFQSIGILRTPEEKLNYLIRSVRVASTLSGGADDLIPILLLTVLRSDISNLASNLYYMKNFVLFGDPSSGEYGYSLSTLEAVSRYIITHIKQLLPFSAKNQEYWDMVRSGDMKGIKNIFSEASECNQTKQKQQPLSASPLLRRTSVASFGTDSDHSMPESVIQEPPSISAIKSRDFVGNNGVLIACQAQQMEVLRYLVEEQGQSVDVWNYEGKTPLMLCANLKNKDMIQFILHQAQGIKEADLKAIINRQDVLGNTAVHVCVAAKKDNRENLVVLEELLKSEPDLGLPNNEGDTPLIISAKKQQDDYSKDRDRDHGGNQIISALTKKMAPRDLDRQNNSGDTALHFINDPKLIQDLISCGANPDIENYAGWTPLLKWTLHDNTAAVESLLATGDCVDPLITDSRGYTPLHMACLRGNLEMVKLLEERTSMVDIQSAVDGSTPLQLACQSNSAVVVEFLLQRGANPELRDWANESPADMTNDPIILDMLDNAMLFWDSDDHCYVHNRSSEKSSLSLSLSKVQGKKPTPSSNLPKKAIRVVRGTMERDGKVRYIVKSGASSGPSTIVTMLRSLEDFQFLRQNLLIEGPDACIPSLKDFYSPFLLSPSRPSKTVLAISARRLDMFLNYLSSHPVLANHELVWEFILIPELQRDLILERSMIKQENAIDSIFDNFPSTIENLEHEEMYFHHLNEEVLRLEAAVQQVRKCARKLSRSTQDVPQQLDILAGALDRSYLIDFDNKSEYVNATKAIASTQTTMRASDIESFGNLFEDFSFVIDGTLKALKHPQEIIASIRQLRVVAQKTEQSMRRNDMWRSGLFTIGGGAKYAVNGAGAALGAVGHVATSAFGAVSESFASGSGRRQHIRAASESAVGRSSKIRSAPSSPSSSTPQVISPSTPPLLPYNKRSSLVMKLTPSMSQTSLTSAASSNSIISSPFRSRRGGQSPVTKNMMTSTSLHTPPFSSITTVTSSKSTAQASSLEEIEGKIGEASSLLNSLRGSLFEELAHLQNHHTKELEKAMRDFGARQLQIERSRLHDMIGILNDLRIESNTTAFSTRIAAVAVTDGIQVTGSNSSVAGGSRSLMEPNLDLTLGRISRNISRQSSIHAKTPRVGSGASLIGDGVGSLFEFGDDEKVEVRKYQRQQHEHQRKNSANRESGHGRNMVSEDGQNNGSTSRKDINSDQEDVLSEKIPFDD